MKYSNDVAGLRYFLLESFVSVWDKYVDTFKLAKSECSEVNVHDLRVAIRRLIVVLSVVIRVNSSPYAIDLRNTLREQFKALSKLRDTQALIVHVTKLINKFPELLGFREFLLAREKRLVKLTSRMLKRVRFEELEGSCFFIKYELKYSGISSKNFNIMLNILSEYHTIFLKKNRLAVPEDINSVHSVRISLKKYRYLSEAIIPIFGRKKKDLKYLADLQDSLGLVQDYSMLAAVFAKFAKKYAKDVFEYAQFEDYLKIKVKSNVLGSIQNISELPEKPLIFYTIDDLELFD